MAEVINSPCELRVAVRVSTTVISHGHIGWQRVRHADVAHCAVAGVAESHGVFDDAAGEDFARTRSLCEFQCIRSSGLIDRVGIECNGAACHLCAVGECIRIWAVAHICIKREDFTGVGSNVDIIPADE